MTTDQHLDAMKTLPAWSNSPPPNPSCDEFCLLVWEKGETGEYEWAHRILEGINGTWQDHEYIETGEFDWWIKIPSPGIEWNDSPPPTGKDGDMILAWEVQDGDKPEFEGPYFSRWHNGRWESTWPFKMWLPLPPASWCVCCNRPL